MPLNILSLPILPTQNGFLPQIGFALPKSLMALDLSEAQVQFGSEALEGFFKNASKNLVDSLTLVLPKPFDPENVLTLNQFVDQIMWIQIIHRYYLFFGLEK